ncbi:MAG TPA: hypothetical protein VJ838_08925 [Gaiellaceae bacterium]|nr:hypothetical protein [Gaiellaceae bacterium]
MADDTQQDSWKPDADARVSRLKAFKIGNVPPPVIARVEQLCDLVDDADGIRPDRQVMVAALIYAATADGKALASAWQKYRTAKVRDLLIGDWPTDGPIDLTGYTKSARESS